MVVVVQRLERLTVDQEAAGSNPVNHPSPVGEIGRRGGMRCRCPSWRGSSSLSPGTPFYHAPVAKRLRNLVYAQAFAG